MDMDAIGSQLLYRHSTDNAQPRPEDTPRREYPVDGHHPGRRIGHAHRQEQIRDIEHRREIDREHDRKDLRHGDDEGGIMRYQRSDRTALSIRTQEGDVVRLKIRATDSIGTRTGEADDDGETVSSLELQARSHTRISFRVKGELNEAELAAIQSVIGQAGAMAEDFFGGDAEAAFAMASALDIDATQLARVQIRMQRSEQLTYPLSNIVPAQPGEAPVAETRPDKTATEPVTESTPEKTDAPPVSADDKAAGADAGAGTTAVPDPEKNATDTAPGDAEPITFMANALQSIGVFMNNLISTFGGADETGESEAAPADMTLKLQIFRSLLVSVSELQNPEEQDPATALAAETIDAVSAQQNPLDAVA
ncbi:MAG: hypothetical protein R3308_01710 [Thiohalobacterales bacterium]|nr:hypothetical protein [Thiohalobacterales bacterium]